MVVVTALNVYREFVDPPPPPPPPTPPTPIVSVPDWAKYKSPDIVHGAPDAPLHFVVLSDYECPACRKLDADLARLAETHAPNVAVSIRHVLGPGHQNAEKAAQFAICGAQVQALPEINRVLFDSARALGALTPSQLVSAARVPDSARFDQCLANASYAPRLAEDVEVRKSLLLTGTPTILFNERRMNGSPGYQFLDSLVREDLPKVRRRGL